MNPILYLGDDDISRAAIYLAGVLSHYAIPFERVDSTQSPDADFYVKKYSLYILSDYPRKQFLTGQLEHLVEAVRQGSGLLMVGGWESFHGKDGEYHDSPLVEVLPVTMSNHDDRRNCFQPLVARRVREHEILENLPWGEAPPTFGGYNAITPKPEATVLLNAVRVNLQNLQSGETRLTTGMETVPLLIVGTFGRGKTAALATDVAPHWAGGFVDWGDQRITQTVGDGFVEIGNHYAQLLRNLTLFLSR